MLITTEYWQLNGEPGEHCGLTLYFLYRTERKQRRDGSKDEGVSIVFPLVRDAETDEVWDLYYVCHTLRTDPDLDDMRSGSWRLVADKREGLGIVEFRGVSFYLGAYIWGDLLDLAEKINFVEPGEPCQVGV